MESTPGPEVAHFIFRIVMQFMHYHPNVGCIQEMITNWQNQIETSPVTNFKIKYTNMLICWWQLGEQFRKRSRHFSDESGASKNQQA